MKGEHMWDVVRHLQQLDFPDSVRAGLDQLVACCSQESSNSIPGLGGTSEDFARQLVEEFIFYSLNPTGRGRHNKRLTATQQLQLLDTIILCYQKLEKDVGGIAVGTCVFQALFGASELQDARLQCLCKLVSLGVGVQCRTLLDSAANWIQMQGCHSVSVRTMVETLIEDYCSLVPGASCGLRDLPKLSAHFACNLISTATILYKQPGHLNPTKRPVILKELIPLVTDWIANDPRLCLVSLFQSQSAKYAEPLWTSPSKPNTQTPIPGLIRWCTQAQLLTDLSCKRNILQPVDKPEPDSSQNWVSNVDMESGHIWSKLHLGILQTLLIFPTLPGAPQLEVITLSDMQRVVGEFRDLFQRRNDHKGGGNSMEHVGNSDSMSPDLEVSLERLVQILQIALATGAFRCSLGDLKKICDSIPPTTLKSIVERQHLSTGPPLMHNAS